MEKCMTIWHITLYDKNSEGVSFSDEYFVKEEATQKYIEKNKEVWKQMDLVYTFGGETFWL